MLEITQASWRGWPISACILMLVNSLVRAAASVAETQVAFVVLIRISLRHARGSPVVAGSDAHADFEHARTRKAAEAEGHQM